MILVVCGVSGAGKTTIGRLLAEKLQCEFEDADNFHPEANVTKMAAGEPLTDADRAPWLSRLASLIADARESGDNLVLACSALRRTYREQLGINQTDVISIFLDGPEALIASRIRDRRHQFMPTSLLQSQFAALEPPQDGLVISIDQNPEQVIADICSKLENL